MPTPFFLSEELARKIEERKGPLPTLRLLTVQNDEDEAPSHSFQYVSNVHSYSDSDNLLDFAIEAGYPQIGEAPIDYVVAVKYADEEETKPVFADFRVLFGTLVRRNKKNNLHEETLFEEKGIPFDKVWACEAFAKNFWGTRAVYPLAPWDIVVHVTPSHAYATDNFGWENEAFTPDPNEGKIIFAHGAKLVTPEETVLTRNGRIHGPRGRAAHQNG